VRILCVCDQGVSRSPTIASLLQYRGHETLSVGAARTTDDTRQMLGDWCDIAILTPDIDVDAIPGLNPEQLVVWPIADTYPRPFHPELRQLVLELAGKGGL
jgi:hypothetical protein